MTRWRVLSTLIAKDFQSHLRDRRTLVTIAVVIVGMPALYSLLIAAVIDKSRRQREAPLTIPVVQTLAAEGFAVVARVRGHAIQVIDAVDREGIRNDQYKINVEFTEGFTEKLRRGERPRVNVYYNPDNEDGEAAFVRVAALLQQYSQSIAIRRLALKGVLPETLEPFRVQTIKIGQGSVLFRVLMGLLSMILAMACFLTTAQLAADMLAGERERQSLEPLLQNPVPRYLFPLAKATVLFVFVAVGCMAALVVFLGVSSSDLFLSMSQMKQTLGLHHAAAAWLVQLPVAFMVVWTQLCLSGFARTVKEAQTSCSVLGVVGFLPAALVGVIPTELQSELLWVPSLGQSILIGRIASNTPIAAADYALCSLGCIFIGLGVAAIVFWQFGRESIVVRIR